MELQTQTNYLPLLQSLVGSLGAFAVAAFTVWVTNKHARVREEEKDRRARRADRIRDLTDRLAPLIDHVTDAFRQVTGSHRGAALVGSKGPAVEPTMTFEVPTGDHSALMARAVTHAELHFPTLVQTLRNLSDEMVTLNAIAVAGTLEAAVDAERWKASGSQAFVARFMEGLRPVFEARQKVANEARRLIANDFDLSA